MVERYRLRLATPQAQTNLVMPTGGLAALVGPETVAAVSPSPSVLSLR